MSTDGRWFSRMYSRIMAILAILVAIAAIFIPEVRWAMLSVALGAFALAIAWDSHRIAKYTDNKLKELSQTLIRLETLQSEIRTEQERQTSANTPVVASMTALSQLVEFFGKKKAGEGQSNKKS